MAVMSINYVKSFELNPQAIVLALVLELGIDPGTCRALGAIYNSSAGPSRSLQSSPIGDRRPTASSTAAPYPNVKEIPSIHYMWHLQEHETVGPFCSPILYCP